MTDTWTDARIQMLRELWPDPKISCAKIACELGVTRNSAIGKGRRLGLGPKPSSHPKTNTPCRKPTRVHTGNINRKRAERNFGSVWGAYPEKAPEPFIPRAADIVSLELTILEVQQGQCKYIAGDDRLCCGHPVKEGKPYCPSHCALVYYTPVKRSPAQKAWDAKLNQRTARRNPDAQAWIAEEVAA